MLVVAFAIFMAFAGIAWKDSPTSTNAEASVPFWLGCAIVTLGFKVFA